MCCLFWIVRKAKHSEMSHMRRSHVRANSPRELTELRIEDGTWHKLRMLTITEFTGSRWKTRNPVFPPVPYTTASNAVPVVIKEEVPHLMPCCSPMPFPPQYAYVRSLQPTCVWRQFPKLSVNILFKNTIFKDVTQIKMPYIQPTPNNQ